MQVLSFLNVELQSSLPLFCAVRCASAFRLTLRARHTQTSKQTSAMRTGPIRGASTFSQSETTVKQKKSRLNAALTRASLEWKDLRFSFPYQMQNVSQCTESVCASPPRSKNKRLFLTLAALQQRTKLRLRPFSFTKLTRMLLASCFLHSLNNQAAMRARKAEKKTFCGCANSIFFCALDAQRKLGHEGSSSFAERKLSSKGAWIQT